jgi:hypothetical protein
MKGEQLAFLTNYFRYYADNPKFFSTNLLIFLYKESSAAKKHELTKQKVHLHQTPSLN